MNKMTKGALAAVAAVVLLTGGVGTLAYWTASDDTNAGDINAGTLTLTSNEDCGAWAYAEGAAGAGTPVELFVPGDVVATTCSFTIGATGDNLEATVTAPDTLEFETTPPGTSFTATVGATYDLAGVPLVDGDTVTEANDGDTLTVAFNVTIPYGDEEAVNTNDTQSILATLNTLTVQLTQVNPNP